MRHVLSFSVYEYTFEDILFLKTLMSKNSEEVVEKFIWVSFVFLIADFTEPPCGVVEILVTGPSNIGKNEIYMVLKNKYLFVSGVCVVWCVCVCVYYG